MLIYKIVHLFGAKKTKKGLKIIEQSGVSYWFLLFFIFFDDDQARGTKRNGRTGKFFWTFDTENMNQSIPVGNKTSSRIVLLQATSVRNTIRKGASMC